MRPIDRSEILPLGDYEAIRPRFRARVIEEKKPRRVAVGDFISVVFENRDSVMMQIQEMLRTERITSESGILHEIETYNDLIPGEDELSVTLFIEIADRETRERTLAELVKLEAFVAIEVDGERFAAQGTPSPGAVETRTTAVHYLKLPLSKEAANKLRARSGSAAIVVSHPKLSVRADLGRATLQKLADDLAPAS